MPAPSTLNQTSKTLNSSYVRITNAILNYLNQPLNSIVAIIDKNNAAHGTPWTPVRDTIMLLTNRDYQITTDTTCEQLHDIVALINKVVTQIPDTIKEDIYGPKSMDLNDMKALWRPHTNIQRNLATLECILENRTTS